MIDPPPLNVQIDNKFLKIAFLSLLGCQSILYSITASAKMGARMPQMRPKEEQKVSAIARTLVGKSSAV